MKKFLTVLVMILTSLSIFGQNFFEKSKFYIFPDKNYKNGKYFAVSIDTATKIYQFYKLTAIKDSDGTVVLELLDDKKHEIHKKSDNIFIFNVLAPEFHIISQNVGYDFYFARNINLTVGNPEKKPVMNLIVVKNEKTGKLKLIPLDKQYKQTYKFPFWYLRENKSLTEQIASYTAEKHFIYFKISVVEYGKTATNKQFSAIYFPTLDEISIR